MRVKIKPGLDPGTGRKKCMRYVCGRSNLLQSSKEVKAGAKAGANNHFLLDPVMQVHFPGKSTKQEGRPAPSEKKGGTKTCDNIIRIIRKRTAPKEKGAEARYCTL